MKFISWSCILIVFVVLTSCSTSSDVVQNSAIQKRKYRKGYHINNVLHRKKSFKKNEVESIAAIDPISSSKLESKSQDKVSTPLSRKLSYKNFDSKVDKDEAPKNKMLSRKLDKVISKVERRVNSTLPNKLKLPIAKEGNIEEDGSSDADVMGLVALLLGIGAFVFSLISIAIPIIGLLGLVAAIMAIVIGNKYKAQSILAKIGFVLGWIYVGIAILTLLVVLLIVVLIVNAL